MDSRAITRPGSFPVSKIAQRLGLNAEAVDALTVVLSSVDRERLKTTAQLVSRHASRTWKRTRHAARVNPSMLYGGLSATIAGIAILAFSVYRAGTMLAEAS